MGLSLSPLLFSRKVLLLLIPILFFIWWQRMNYVRDMTAYRGYSPIGIVYEKAYPENFKNNFPGGTQGYNRSAFMYVYHFAYEYLGIPPEIMVPAVMALEVVLIALSLLVLCHVLLPNAPPFIYLMVVVLVLGSGMEEMNLTNIHFYLQGKVNNVAKAGTILAVAASLAGGYLIAGVLLAFAFTVHPLETLPGGIFVAGLFLARFRDLLKPRTILAAVIFLAVTILWVVWMFEPQNFTGTGIPADIWFKATQMGSSHWYPIKLGYFTLFHDRHFLPFLSFLSLFALYFPDRREHLWPALLAGISALLAVLVIGCIVPSLEISRTLVKMQLTRPSILIILLGLPFVVSGLWREIHQSGPLRAAAAVMVLVSPFFATPGFPLVFTLVLVLPYLREIPNKHGEIRYKVAAGLGLTALLLLSLYVALGLAKSWDNPAYTGGWPFVVAFVALTAFWSIWPYLIRSKVPLTNLALVLFVSAGAIFWTVSEAPRAERLAISRDFKEAQLWARNNTPKDALFMLDPAFRGFGWRDYSHRSSFGTVREWFYNWATTNDVSYFQESMKRLRIFDIELESYFRPRRPIRGIFRVLKDTEEAFYSMEDDRLLELAKQYGIDYFVMLKDRICNPSKLKIVFENSQFVILKSERTDHYTLNPSSSP